MEDKDLFSSRAWQFHLALGGMETFVTWEALSLLLGMEKISVLAQQMIIDTDGDGKLSPEEIKAQDEHAEAIINKALDFSTNTGYQSVLSVLSASILSWLLGIVGALLFSVLFSSASSSLAPCDESLEYFGETGIHVLSGAYNVFVTTSLLISLGLILNFVMQYIYISSWMPTNEIKLWYLREKSPLVQMGGASVTCICCVVTSIPCAVAVNIGIYLSIF